MKLLYKAAGGNTESATIYGICEIGTIHLFALISLLDSKFEPITGYLIMIFACIPNIWSCIKIIKLHKLGRYMDEQKNKEVEYLVLQEILELAVQIVYCTSFLIAYFGPNATVLGNVYNGWWQFEIVHSWIDKLTNVFIFFCIDVVQGILLGFTLYHFCRLNVYEVYLFRLRQYGPLICLRLCEHMCLVRMY